MLYGTSIYTLVQQFVYAVFGFLVPYFDLDVIRLPTPPWDALAEYCEKTRAPDQIQCASDQVIFHTRAILCSASSYHDDRVLLHVVT